MNKKIVLISQKFAPGHYSHLSAFINLFQELGFSVSLFLAEEYKSFVDRDDVQIEYPTNEVSFSGEADFALIFNLSTHDSRLIKNMRHKNMNIKIMFVYHEPYRGLWESISSVFARQRSIKHFVSIVGRHLFSINVLKSSDIVLLPSNSALLEYEQFDYSYNDNCSFFPLIFTDEDVDLQNCTKEYFSFISTAISAKGFSEYCAFMRESLRLGGKIKFQIVTRSNIEDFIDSELQPYLESGQVHIQHNRILTNREINEAYAKSICTWFAYNKSTQSGVLCKSFMFGSPGIATKIGAFPEYINGKNGLLIDDNKSFSELNNAYLEVENNLTFFSINARKLYLEKFDYRSALNGMKQIVKGLC